MIALIINITSSSLVFAQTTGWISDVKHPPVKLRLMLTGEQQTHTRTLQAVLDVQLEGEWKTYWRSPGEAGIAPQLDWGNSTNIAAVEWHWPIPRYFEQLGIMTLGYKHQVSFPLTITLEDPLQPAVLKGQLRLPSCTDICVITDYPIELEFNPQALHLDSEAMFLFNQGMSQSPKDSNQVMVNKTYWDQNKQQFIVQLSNAIAWQSPQVLVDGQQVENQFFDQPKLIFDQEVNRLTAIFDVTNWKGHVDLNGKSVTVTVSDNTFATELTTEVGTTPIEYQSTSFITMIGFAFLGGLILNIMPCVLPVLGLKLNSIATQSTSQGGVRASFIASALGIISSFALLAAALSLLKAGGESVGWGIQFQSVEFLILMLMVTLVFALNLLGLFEFRLPSRLTTWMSQQGGHGQAGHFIQGMFATLLATPCSAPFLGTAVAYALGASFSELWIIFITLGIGMSAPWLIFALFPNVVAAMPKPGVWMNRTKMLFGFMMLLTSLWLTSLLMPFFGQFIVLVICGAILIVTFIWLGQVHGRKLLIPLIALLTFIGGGSLLLGSLTADHWATPIVDDLPWQKLQADKIQQLSAQGKTVFVDVTADWCITCKANKIGVILQDPVYSALKHQDMVLMKGNWTTPNDSVTQYLQSNGRYGVPFNIVYGPNAPQGIALPVILTSDQVISAINKAGNK
ncbi:protein-disulfide reductase DsbD family protein [Vibrio ichthyoenteri]|nr:protein-disulfide reductase DsbD domain-containing protein [Vibrio ichthyoenteri]